MSARNFRTVSNFIPIHAGGGDGNGFMSPTIYYIENPLSDDIQKTEGAANLNMDDAIGPQHGPVSVLGAEDAVHDAANGGADAAVDTVGDAAVDVGLSSSSSLLSISLTVDHAGTTENNADDDGADASAASHHPNITGQVGGENVFSRGDFFSSIPTPNLIPRLQETGCFVLEGQQRTAILPTTNTTAPLPVSVASSMARVSV
ncbi:hypothetical protein EC957_011918 [Mortierella hygrophila]|uniref:Uncharacterized protein n=1 Tax=Mortierella hygrophila TaxID=979708 RepID=A0A9P6F862_9FUNG|nr:hypothetical protein EC957_011918 [Mortierella hygrophila]